MSDVMIVGIAGGTGSGKTTITRKLMQRFEGDVSVINHDNYYKAHHDMPYEERTKLNYDHPDAFDTEMLIDALRELKQGHAVKCPVYDYSIHDRTDKHAYDYGRGNRRPCRKPESQRRRGREDHRVAAHHDKIAMGKVYKADYSVYHCVAQRNQRINAAQSQADYKRLKKCVHSAHPLCMFCGMSMKAAVNSYRAVFTAL